MPYYDVKLLPERDVGWDCDDGNEPGYHVWGKILVDFYFLKSNTIFAVLSYNCLEVFHKLQRINIMNQVTTTLVR
jgi:hypothetical protein